MKCIEVITTILLVLMGTIDCVTTVVGITYAGATEVNPAMAGIVNSNIGAFAAVKIMATVLIAFTYIYANRILTKNSNKTSRSIKLSSKLLQISYGGIAVFFCVVVANNLVVLLA